MTWVVVVFFFGVEQPEVKFDDFNLCVRYARVLTQQSYFMAQAGEELPVRAYCIPNNRNK